MRRKVFFFICKVGSLIIHTTKTMVQFPFQVPRF